MYVEVGANWGDRGEGGGGDGGEEKGKQEGDGSSKMTGMRRLRQEQNADRPAHFRKQIQERDPSNILTG